MLKFRTFCLFLLVFLFSGVVEAKVCFLPGILSGDGCLEETAIAACPGWGRTKECPSGYTQTECYSEKTTYYKCACKEDNIKDLGIKYVCAKDYDPSCGCAKTDVVCNKNTFKYKESDCAKYLNSKPDGELCQNLSDKSIFYERCGCSEDDYPYTCTERGLTVNTTAPKCTNSDGETRYSFCGCDSSAGWSTISCEQNTGGCTTETDSVFNGLGTCHKCEVGQCTDTTEKNLYSFYCDISGMVNTDCLDLGYVYDADGKCKDGSNGLKCPFGMSYIYCDPASNAECEHTTIDSCLQKDPYAVCAPTSFNCYSMVGCQSGYKLSADGTSCVERTCLDDGFVSCNADGVVGDGATCEDSTGIYYTKCVTAEKCYDVFEGDVAYGTSKGYCELVVPKSTVQTYLNSGYYEVETCQPVNVGKEERVRLHLCESETADCAGGYSPVKGGVTSCANENDGTVKTCGGKTYKVNCACNDENDGAYASLCRVAEVTDGVKKGDVAKFDYNNYVFTGVIKPGCEGMDTKYGYFTSAHSHVNYCAGTSLTEDALYKGAEDICDSEEDQTCSAANVLAVTNDGRYTYCSATCTTPEKEEGVCGQYDKLSYTGSGFCRVYEQGTVKSGYEELGVVSETAGSSTKCSYYASCGDTAYCNKKGYTTPLLPAGYKTCSVSYIPEGAVSTECGGKTYYSGCCDIKKGCEYTNSSTTLNEKLSNGYYQVSVSADSGCYYYAACESTSADCSGNVSPVAGRVTQEQCASINAYATSYVACGGKSYPTACAAICNYDKTEADCAALGKQFKLECVKNDEDGGFRLGQCV